MKKILFIMLMASLSFAGLRDVANNWKGIMDTVVMRNTLDSLSYKYTAPYVITDGEDMCVMIKCNDTTASGFASDSFNFSWGYQLGNLTRNSSGVLDTVWSGFDRFVIDTVRTDSLGVVRTGFTIPGGTTTRYYGGVDTLSITGYAVQDRWIVPEWRPIMRLWAMGLGGKQKRGTYTKIIFQLTQRVGVQIK
jgi:hypothetical protein